MHPMLLDDVVALCRRRQEQGDHPSEPAASVERLEDAVVQLAEVLGGELEARADSAVPSRDDDGGAAQPVAAGWSDATKYAFEALNPKPRENPNKGLMIRTRAMVAAVPSSHVSGTDDKEWPPRLTFTARGVAALFLIAAAEKHCESYHDDPRWADHNFRADLMNAFFQGSHWKSNIETDPLGNGDDCAP